MVSAEEVERHLSVGHAVVMLPDPPREDGYRERLHIRGWQRGQYLLLDAEITRNTRGIFRPDSACLLRFVSEGFACVGHSLVQDLGTGSHFSYMRVKWPTQFSSVPVRRYERVHVHVECAISDGERTVAGELTDMSVGGCRIFSDELFPVDADCKVSFTLPDGVAVDGLSIAVCNCARSGSRYSLGCMYSDRDELAWNDVEFYVATTLTRVRGEAPLRSSVLVLEPEPRLVQTVRHSLEQAGYEVAVTQSAVDAFFMLRMHSPELLLCSLAVPDMDAGAFCATLRASRQFETLPIIVYGGTDNEAQEALNAGANERLASLTPSPELTDLVERYTRTDESPHAAAG